MSPLLIRSTYSAATFSGPITASSVCVDALDDLPEVALVPASRRRASPAARPPPPSTSMSASAISAFRFVRTCSIVSLMNAFLPGNRSSGASKLPRAELGDARHRLLLHRDVARRPCR